MVRALMENRFLNQAPRACDNGDSWRSQAANHQSRQWRRQIPAAPPGADYGQRRPYACTMASNCKDALKAAENTRFDLLISDIGLPDGDGCDLLKQLRAMYPIRAISITAYVMPKDIERYRAAGFDEHVAKPLAWETFVNAVDHVIGAPPKLKWRNGRIDAITWH
jgi:CheY-like chemotaxis protein